MNDDIKVVLIELGVVCIMAVFCSILLLPIGLAHTAQYDCIGEWETLNLINDKDGYTINFFENGTGSITTKLSSNTFTWKVIETHIEATVYLSDKSTTYITFEYDGEKLHLGNIVLYKRTFV